MNFDKFSRLFSAEWVTSVDFINAAIESLNIPRGAKVLDIGTGPGASACLLALHGFDVITGQPEHAHHEHHDEHGGHAPSTDHADTTPLWEQNAEALSLSDKIDFETFEAEHLPYADDHFDASVMFDSLHHIDDKGQALKEALRVVNVGGCVVVVEWTEEHIKKAAMERDITFNTIDPREILPEVPLSIEVMAGDLYNIFILWQKSTA